MTERLLVVHCPDWPAVASGLLATATGHQLAVAVLFANRVVACSEGARAEGIERGLRRRQAESRCPGMIVVADDPARDARAFEPVVAAVEAFTTGVEIVRPGTCAFATRGPSRYFGGDVALAAKVAAAVDAALPPGAPRCRVGVADGRLAAELAALASVVSGAGMVVPRGGSPSFLAPFPVSVATGDHPDVADLLVRLGIRALGDLAALPGPAVLARFGTAGAAIRRLARGLDEQPLAARTPPPDLAVTAELDPPADRLETVAFVARALADQLHLALATRGLAATRVLVEAETEHGEWLARRWRHDGGLTPAALAERVRWQLDGWLAGRAVTGGDETTGGAVAFASRAAAGEGGSGTFVGALGSPGAPDATKNAGRGSGGATHRPSGGLVLLRLTPDEVGPDDGRQLGFWGGDRAAAERASRALARVQGVLGPESVLVATLAGGRGPSEQACLLPWDDARPSTGGAGAALTLDRRWPEGDAVPPWPGRIPPPAPATVHPLAPPAEVLDVDGRRVAVTGRATISAPPARLAVAGRPPVEVVAWAGPWPVDERWWDPAAHRRRARSQVVTADGVAHLLVVEDGRWAVEATYD